MSVDRCKPSLLQQQHLWALNGPPTYPQQQLSLLPGGAKARSNFCADGVPPVQQERGLPPALEGLPDKVPCNGGYRYVLFHLWFITITRKSVSVAIAASCLTFVALQVC